MKKLKTLKKAPKSSTTKKIQKKSSNNIQKIKFPTKKISNEKIEVIAKSEETPTVVTQPIEVPVKKKKTSVMYFTQDTEDAIVDFNTTQDKKEKDRIYNERIRFPFEKIAENIFNTIKFSYNEVAPLEVQREAVSHMVANMQKYEKGKGKAFSYFSIVAKHWFILENNNNYRRFKKHVSISEQPGDVGEFIVEPEHSKKENETREFIKLMVSFWDENVGTYFNKERDLKIANAVIEIFRSSDRIDVFNKKALYLYIREIADCQTQHITKVINRMKDAQAIILEEYLSTGKVSGSVY